MSSGFSKELNVQNVSYFMEFLSCSEKRYSLICLENISVPPNRQRHVTKTSEKFHPLSFYYFR